MSVIGHGVEIVANAAARPVGPAEGTLIYQQDTNQLLLWDNSDWQSVFPAPPTGSIQAYAGTTEPIGWLFCSGQPISRTIYSSLFDVIGTTYGVGDGATTFNLPDLRGRAPAGRDNMGGSAANRITSGGSGITGSTLGASGGAETHTLTTAQMPSHRHNTTYSYARTRGYSAVYNGGPGGYAHHELDNTTTYTGGNGAHQNTQPTIILNYLIKL